MSSSGARSIRQPSTSSMTLISIRITSRLCDSVRKNAVILAGSCINAITYPNAEAQAIRVITIATVLSVLWTRVGRSRQR